MAQEPGPPGLPQVPQAPPPPGATGIPEELTPVDAAVGVENADSFLSSVVDRQCGHSTRVDERTSASKSLPHPLH
jgi:hypothetical protein